MDPRQDLPEKQPKEGSEMAIAETAEVKIIRDEHERALDALLRISYAVGSVMEITEILDRIVQDIEIAHDSALVLPSHSPFQVLDILTKTAIEELLVVERDSDLAVL